MSHYSMPVGLTWLVDSADLSPAVVDRLLPTIADGYHDLPFKGYKIGVGLFRHRAGWICGAHAVVFADARLAGTFTVALTAEDAEALWKPFESFYLRATDRGLPNRADWACPIMPKIVPWVASFPVNCTSVEADLLPRLASLWAMTLSKIAVDEMKGCA